MFYLFFLKLFFTYVFVRDFKVVWDLLMILVSRCFTSRQRVSAGLPPIRGEDYRAVGGGGGGISAARCDGSARGANRAGTAAAPPRRVRLAGGKAHLSPCH